MSPGRAPFSLPGQLDHSLPLQLLGTRDYEWAGATILSRPQPSNDPKGPAALHGRVESSYLLPGPASQVKDACLNRGEHRSACNIPVSVNCLRFRLCAPLTLGLATFTTVCYHHLVVEKRVTRMAKLSNASSMSRFLISFHPRIQWMNTVWQKRHEYQVQLVPEPGLEPLLSHFVQYSTVPTAGDD
jgi:hypothetical protein